MLTPEEREERRRAAKRKWKEKNPDYNWYKDHPEEQKKAKLRYAQSERGKAKMRAYYRDVEKAKRKEHIKEQKAYADGLKALRGCAVCGEKDPIVLEWDHVLPSTKCGNIGDFFKRSREMLDEELAKCQVLCGTCHKRKTHQDRLAGF